MFFRSCVLLTTDVAARGLDIPNVQHVIHYQVSTFIHKIFPSMRPVYTNCANPGPQDI